MANATLKVKPNTRYIDKLVRVLGWSRTAKDVMESPYYDEAQKQGIYEYLNELNRNDPT